MAKYLVTLHMKTIHWEQASVEVDADTPEAAARAARDIDHEGKATWETMQTECEDATEFDVRAGAREDYEPPFSMPNMWQGPKDGGVVLSGDYDDIEDEKAEEPA